MLIELSNQNAPSLLLLDYNYLINKAINLYINKQYNTYDFNLLSTDSLRVLKATCFLQPKLAYTENKYLASTDLGRKYTRLNNLYGATYEVELPEDYLHVLNCVCIYLVHKTFRCYDKGSFVLFAAKRLSTNLWSNIINDFYQRPLPERPYFYIHNINKLNELLTNEYKDGTGTDLLILPSIGPHIELNISGHQYPLKLKRANETDMTFLAPDLLMSEEEFASYSSSGFDYSKGFTFSTSLLVLDTTNRTVYKVKDLNVLSIALSPSSVSLYDSNWTLEIINSPNGAYFNRDIFTSLFGNVSAVEKPGGIRYSNPSPLRMEIRYGKDNTVFELKEVLVDYIKSPLHIRLTQEQLDLTEDTSQIIEFPDYVCQEIINELVTIVMENTKDDRLQTHVAVTLSIALPTQQLAQS